MGASGYFGNVFVVLRFKNELQAASPTFIIHSSLAHVGIGASKVAIKTCRKTNLAGTRAPPRNRVANTKIIFVLARLRIAPLASDWPGTFQEFIEGYGGEMLEPTRPLST